jgi:hypothetical protein
MKFAYPPTQVPAQAKRYPSVKALLKDQNVRRYLKKLSAQYRYPDKICRSFIISCMLSVVA